VFVVADERLFDIHVIEKLQRDARVLRGDEINVRQDGRGARRQVAEIPDGRRHQI
jgi:hypothetical protein